MSRPDKLTAENAHSFHETIKKGDGIRYGDYQMIERIRKDDIPALKKDLESEIDRISRTGVGKSKEEIAAEQEQWKRFLASINALEASWRTGQLKIENHREENYEKTKELTRKKLAELFGEVSGSNAAQLAPRPGAEPTKIDGEGFINEALGLIDSPDQLRKHLERVDGKIDQKGKDTLLEMVSTRIERERNSGKRAKLERVKAAIGALKIRSDAPETKENPVNALIKGVQSKLDQYAKSKGYTSIQLKGTGVFAKNTDNTAPHEMYQVTLNRDIALIDGTSGPMKLFVISDISLQTSHLGTLKTVDVLSKEITTKIEEEMSRLESQKPSLFDANKKFLESQKSYIDALLKKIPENPEPIWLKQVPTLLLNPTEGNIKKLQEYLDITPDGKLSDTLIDALGKKFPNPASRPDARASTPEPARGDTRLERARSYNKNFLENNKSTFDALIKGGRLPSDIQRLLLAYLKDYTPDNANALQDVLENKYGKSTGARGSVGPLTLKAIQELSTGAQNPEVGDITLNEGELGQINGIVLKNLKGSRFIKYDLITKQFTYKENPFGIMHADLTQILDGKTPQKRLAIVSALNKKWNQEAEKFVKEKNAGKEPGILQRESERTHEAQKKSIFEQGSRFIDRRISSERTRKEDGLIFFEGNGYKSVKNPFNLVSIPSESGIQANDLQMSISLVTAYEQVITGNALTYWRNNLSPTEREQIIQQLNAEWDKKSEGKIKELNAEFRKKLLRR